MAYIAWALALVGSLAIMAYMIVTGHPWGAFAAFFIASCLKVETKSGSDDS